MSSPSAPPVPGGVVLPPNTVPGTAAAPPAPAGSALRAGELFQVLRDGRARTRAELAEITGLARSTIATRIDALMSCGLIGPAGEALSSGGRPPSRFAFSASSRVVVAVDVGATHVLIALTDLGGRVLDESRAAIEVSVGPVAVLDLVVEQARNLLTRAGRDPRELAGIGIGLPGPVEHSTGKPANPPIMPGWDGFDVPAFVQRAFGRGRELDVLVDNDVNIMALGERAGFWPVEENLLFIKVATGIGAGIVGRGLLQRGADGTAGDIGHVRLARGDGVLCRCGNVGCLEALASGPAVAAALAAAGVPAETGDDVLELVRRGSVDAVQAVRQAGRDIGEVLATCVNLLNPSVIVIGGGLSAAGEYLLAGVREMVYQRSLPLATARLRIVQSMAGDRAGVLGASRMIIDHVLSPDRIGALLADSA